MSGLPLPLRQNKSSVPVAGVLAALALAPVVFIAMQAMHASRNVAYWDEVDSAIAFLVRLDSGVTLRGFIEQLFAVTNEHRTVTSRLLFAVSYWLTGTVNFTVIGIIGNLFICGFGAWLVAATHDAARRVRMLVLIAVFLFQLEHFENFLWSGGSIDHFQVVFLTGATFFLLSRGTRLSAVGAAVCALAATFTLAHGLLAWLGGAALLGQQRRWRTLAVWVSVALGAAIVFLSGFSFNPGHHIGEWSWRAGAQIALYWLSLLGAPVALGQPILSPVLGAMLLGLLGARLARPAPREQWVLPLATWAVASLLLVAVGRTVANAGVIHSRYYVLGALAWLLVLFLQLDDWTRPERPYRALLRTLPLLVLFNVAANLQFRTAAHTWQVVRDAATDGYILNARDGTGPHQIHPNAQYATQMLRTAEEHRVFRMPRLANRKQFPQIHRVEGLSYFFDRIQVDGTIVDIRGWAGFPGREVRPGQIHLVLQSAAQRIYTTLPEERPDVVAAYPNEHWRESGFHFRRRRWLLPPTVYQVGLLINSDHGAELVMTAHRLDLRGAGRGIIAGAE